MKVRGSRLEVNYDITKLPTHEQLESALYVHDYIDIENDNDVETFSDIKAFFDSWNQYEQYCEMYFNGVDSDECRSAYNNDHWETVYDYITDCLHWYGGAFLPVRITD